MNEKPPSQPPSPYRELANEMPPLPRRYAARRAVAIGVVAPVRFAQWAWPWFALNLGLGVMLIGPMISYPRITSFVILGLNVGAAIGYGFYRAYCWAMNELKECSHGE